VLLLQTMTIVRTWYVVNMCSAELHSVVAEKRYVKSAPACWKDGMLAAVARIAATLTLFNVMIPRTSIHSDIRTGYVDVMSSFVLLQPVFA
jgi:hypothetical protein